MDISDFHAIQLHSLISGLMVRPQCRVLKVPGSNPESKEDSRVYGRCIFTMSWPKRKPVPNFKQEWPKRVANNLVSRHKICRIVKFISENGDLFRPPLSSTFQRAEPTSSKLPDIPPPLKKKKSKTTSKEKKTITN
ncbi:hypothetical protein AVEN_169879-1 [Araneus ventricosus]|uniref:Uncharacterized protein n=1 Tax=Araneus ventricosus TaxID=182803 RepID=A0A4Y2ILT3_ARAVE|nr:hypothetical protein AVEN_169879-1 [Araneus ventricosus]